MTNSVDFLLRHDVRLYLVDIELPGDGGSGGAAVTGENDNLDAGGMQVTNSFRGRGLDRIGDADQARRLAIDSDQHDGRTVSPLSIRSLR